MNELKEYLDNIFPLQADEWESFSRHFIEEKLVKDDYFALAGRTESKIGFLKKGVVRAFYKNRDGLEYNKTFFTDNEFLGAYTSLVTGNSNHINMQALTDCVILTANYSNITSLFKDFRNIETLARKISENLYVYKEKREIELVLLQAGERYEIFKKEYPELINQIPQYQIASYLGITPTQLSRIRAKKSPPFISEHM